VKKEQGVGVCMCVHNVKRKIIAGTLQDLFGLTQSAGQSS